MKITYIISDIDKALAFEWIAEELNRNKFPISFVLLNPGASALENFLKEKNIPVTAIVCRGKKDWPSALIKTIRALKQQRPDAVHCHLLQANIIGLLAAKMVGIKKESIPVIILRFTMCTIKKEYYGISGVTKWLPMLLQLVVW